MRKVAINKWFLLTALLTISLSAFSLIAVKKTDSAPEKGSCCQRPNAPVQKGEMIWEVISHQFSAIISIR
jgi:hypothetical protein